MMNNSTVELKNTLGHVYYTGSYDRDEQFVYANWTGYVTFEEVKKGASSVLSLLTQHQATYLINDNTHLEGTWDEANDWIANEWMPQALAVGLTKFAHIVSPDIFGALSAEAMATRVEGFEMRIFEKLSEAVRWLKEPAQV